jgi:phospholipid/cholesterol/gamma-HCH transport system substrate-binding protein
MTQKTSHSIKLGIFVLAGLGFLIFLLYVIGKNQNLFGNTFMLKARFENVHGLMKGNNIRYAGIDAGTVKEIVVLNDSTIEVTLLVQSKMRQFIYKNALVSIGTDGLMGNKLLNIESARHPAPLVEEGDILYSSQSMDTDAMLKVLNATNNDIAVIAKELKQTITKLNSSNTIWTILNDETVPNNIRLSLFRIKDASGKMDQMMVNLNDIILDMKNGKGSIGELLTDTTIAEDLKIAVSGLKNMSTSADSLSLRINALMVSLDDDINYGGGTINTLLKNKEMAERLHQSLKNIEEGSESFNETMDAVKQSFLFRGYFKKQEKVKNEQAIKTKL